MSAHERAVFRLLGSGPVVMALALWLDRQGIDAERIEWVSPARVLPDSLAARAIALSAGSIQLLERIIRMPFSAPIEEVDIRVDGHAGSMRMRPHELDLPQLGCVVRYGALVQALESACATRGIASHEIAADAQPELEIIADGDPGESVEQREFNQSALLAELDAQCEADGIAFECFTASGPLAILPLPEPRRHALVWCDHPALCEQRARLPGKDFETALMAAFGHRLGRLRLASEPHVAPLQRRRSIDTFDARRVRIGNAAQALHPVAGQGLNLGLRDAFELAQSIGDASGGEQTPVQLARRYAAQRRRDRAQTVGFTDTLASVFANPLARGAGALAIGALDLLPIARRMLARRFVYGAR